MDQLNDKMTPEMKNEVADITGYTTGYVRLVLLGKRKCDQIVKACQVLVDLEEEKKRAFAEAVVSSKALIHGHE